ncbi:hypothetical protein JL107_12420 [Nakamurella flavida]|uniref:Thioredoxin domain-containing protein n=1 Tax=Nakamurella flavida TaxID=363630 RepID=A0A938YL96_9ACTN|nr:hypothetical protein [Nakamurella flavida]MBM9477249.1 hypothetical protein [Nakamurella flavida]MDP9779705.1 hypothetical protein [Nakamurella flavida]
MTIVLILLCVVVAVLAVLVVGLLRAYATVLQRLHQLDGGSAPVAANTPPPFRTVDTVPAPPAGAGRDDAEWPVGHDVSGVGLDGEILSVRVLGVPRDTVLLFLSSGCAGCAVFFADLAARTVALPPSARLLVVAHDAHEESVSLLRELCPPGVDLVLSTRAWEDYAVPGSPYVMVVDGRRGRVVGEGSGSSLRQVATLIRQAVGDGAAGLDLPRMPGKPRADVERESDVDDALLAAGITPGHPSLYGAPPQAEHLHLHDISGSR